MNAATKERVLREAQLLGLLFFYLALLLGGFTLYRRQILAEYCITYFQYGYSLIEALVLAKVIMIGRFLRIGEGFGDRPLIVPTLYKTVCFSVFVLAFHTTEHVLFSLLRRKGLSAAFEDLWRTGIHEILAQMVVLFVAFIPLFALWEIGHVLGEGKLFQMFFIRQQAVGENPPKDSVPPPA